MFMGGGTLDGVQVLQPDTVREMRRSQVPDVVDGQGLIWYRTHHRGRTLIGHNGGDYGVATVAFYDPDAGTVVWVLGEVTGLLQLDIWCDSVASADAFYARLPALMSPGEGMAGLLLRAPPGYLSAPVRYLLISRERRDQPESAYANERRVSCTIRFDAPDLDLRCSTLMEPRLTSTVVEPTP